MRSVPNSDKFIIAEESSYPADFRSPNPKGWYHSVANIVSTSEGLVAVYRLSDSHCALCTHLMIAFSADGGRTWTGHRSLSHRNVWEHQSVWLAPQMSRLREGRLVVICDLGHRTSHDDWPMLAHWQKPDRGMANFLFWSDDNGRTWSEPRKCDDIGGEPGYLVELADGSLLYTATVSGRSPEMIDPPMPWGDIYYRSIVMASEDGGRTWGKRSDLTDDPCHGDCEVGLVELEPGHLMALTRIGFGGSQFGQPSRVVHSLDGGRSWGKPGLTPIYGHRIHLARLQSGRLFATFRHRWGTPATYGFAFEPDEGLRYEPSSDIRDEERCRLEDGVMLIATDTIRRSDLPESVPVADTEEDNAVTFSLFPVFDHRSSVELELELRLQPGSGNGSIVIHAGWRIELTEDRLTVADQAAVDATGQPLDRATGRVSRESLEVAVDTGRWHVYRFIRRDQRLEILIDGKSRLRVDLEGRGERLVRFGSRGRLISEWRSGRATIRNPREAEVDWAWRATEGFIDQFRRERMIRLDHTADSGYSGWTQLDDGTVVIADYCNHSFRTSGEPGVSQPVIKAYRVAEADL